MDIQQHEKLLSLYKQAIDKNLSPAEHAKEIRNAKFNLDRTFSKTGNEYNEALKYIDELEQLRNFTNEQSR